MTVSIVVVIVSLSALFATMATAQAPAEGPKIDLPRAGQIKPRTANDIAASDWSIGGETLDRDYADYAKYRDYLGPLGAKHLRLQAGWAKCEKKPGIYDFAWLDAIVDDARAQGVQPWLQTSYGNTIYPGGGGTGLGEGIPRSPEALAAWDNWVRALVRHFRDRINTWEIWNEPDIRNTNTPEIYADLFVRTAEIIRAEQPKSTIYALALAHKTEFADVLLNRLKADGKLGLADAVTIHGYPTNPDDTGNIDRLRAVIDRYAPQIAIRQGETGAPSAIGSSGALSDHAWWSELTQAKWNLRRMLAHRGRDIPFNLFTLMELAYKADGGNRMNTKGLLQAGPGASVARAKPAYFAAQHVFAIFDHTLDRLTDYPAATAVEKLAVFGYARKGTAHQVAAIWLSGGRPADTNELTLIDISLPRGRFTDPVYVDLLSGGVYDIAKDRWAQSIDGCVFRQVPVYDAPILIAERAAVPIGK
jgi:hypothetical protein